MNTIIIHFSTAFLPLLAFIPGVLYYYSDRLGNDKYRKTGLLLIVINAVICTFTSAMGGASINISKNLRDNNQLFLSLHAWTAMAAFIFSLLLAFIAIRQLRSSRKIKYRDKYLSVFSILFLVFYVFTIIISLNIR